MNGYRTWPNLISLLRLPLAAAFVVAEGVAVRGAILAAGAASDYADGWLARRTGQRSRSGEVLDGVVDKIFVLAAFGSFVAVGTLAWWQLLILLARDIYVAVGVLIAFWIRVPVRIRSRWPGKIVTGIQIFAVLVLLVAPEWIGPVVAAAGIAGAVAILDYTRVGLAALRAARAAP